MVMETCDWNVNLEKNMYPIVTPKQWQLLYLLTMAIDDNYYPEENNISF